MADKVTQLIVSLLDRVTGPAQKVAASLRGIGAAASEAGAVSLTDRLAAESAATSAALSKARGEMSGLIMNAFALGGAIGYPLAESAKFRQQMNQVAAVSGATGDQLNQLSQEALLLGRNTQFTSVQTGQAMSYLALSGMGAKDILAAMPDVLKLASSAQMDLGETADIVTQILHDQGIEASKLGWANDVLVKGFTSTNQTLSDLGVAMKYGGGVAHSAGLSLEETVAVLGQFANAGYKADMGGTALRNTLTRLMNPSAEVKKGLREMGITVTDAHGKLLPFDIILQKLAGHSHDTAALMKVFGERAGPAMIGLLRQGLPAYEELLQKLKDSGGTADKISQVQMKGLMGAWRFATSSAQNLAIAIGDALTPAAVELVNRMGDLANTLFDFVQAHPKIVVAAGAIATALLGIKIASVASRIAVLSLKSGLLSILTPLVRVGSYLGGAAMSSVALQAKLAEMSGLRFGGLAVLSTGLRGMIQAVPGVSRLGTAFAAVSEAVAAIAATIGAPVWAVGLVIVAALAAAGAAIWKYWRPIGAFISGVAEGIGSALSPAIQTARPLLNFLADAGDQISKTFSAAWRWFSDWIGASPATPEVLASWKDAGRQLGEGITNAILWPFRKVYDAIKGVADYVISVVPKIDFSGANGGQPMTYGGGQMGPLPGRAHGGPLSAGQPTIVGEDGPELITPTRSAYVHAAGTFGAGSAGRVQIGSLNVYGAPGQSAADIARAVRREIEDMAAKAFRGAQADTGLEVYG